MNDKREKRAAFANAHIDKMRTQYKKEIFSSVTRSVIYRDVKCNPLELGATTDVVIENMTTLEAIDKYVSPEYLACALNFASWKYPGGGFIAGAMAQEESLCAASTLYNVLSDSRFTSYYGYHQGHTQKGLYFNNCIYTPDVTFFTDKEELNCDILTCAAPNWKAAKKLDVQVDDNINAMTSRIRYALMIMQMQGVEVPILGAWGCGVFEQSPEIVSGIFRTMLNQYHFKKAVFAITDKGMCDIFQKNLIK